MSPRGSRFDRGARPAYFLLEALAAERSVPPPREQGLWGDLTIEVECVTEIHVGGSAPDLVVVERGRALIQGMTALPSSGDLEPVVPGSSVKGAVRAVIEALTPSCERVGGDGCWGRSLCPACTVLGAPGWRSMVSFSDLVPSEPVDLVGVLVSQRYSHRSARRRGRRLYGVAPEDPLPSAREGLACLPLGTRLRGSIRLEGATEQGIGLVALALGLAPKGLPLLRLGGGKNRGIAQARSRLLGGAVGRGMASLARRRVDPVDSNVIGEWQSAALVKWPPASGRLEEIRARYSGET